MAVALSEFASELRPVVSDTRLAASCEAALALAHAGRKDMAQPFEASQPFDIEAAALRSAGAHLLRITPSRGSTSNKRSFHAIAKSKGDFSKVTLGGFYPGMKRHDISVKPQ